MDKESIKKNQRIKSHARRPGAVVKTVVFACLLLTFSTAVHSQGPLAENGAKADLVVAYSPKIIPDVDPKDATAAVMVYIQELARQAGRTAQSYPYNNLDTAIKELENGNVDLITMNAVDYLRMKNRNLLELGLGYVKSGKTTSRYLLLTHQKKGYTKTADLKGKKLVTLKGDGVGPLFLSTLLLKQHLGDTGEFFSQVEEKSKPSQVVLSVFFGQADACVVSDALYKTMIEMNPQLEKELKVLAVSPELLEGCSFFRKGMDEGVKQKTLEISKQLRNQSRGKQILMLFKIEELAPLKEADFAGVKELLSEHDRLKAGR